MDRTLYLVLPSQFSWRNHQLQQCHGVLLFHYQMPNHKIMASSYEHEKGVVVHLPFSLIYVCLRVSGSTERSYPITFASGGRFLRSECLNPDSILIFHSHSAKNEKCQLHALASSLM